MTRTNLYNFENIEIRKKQSKICWIFLIVSFVLVISGLIGITFFVNDKNAVVLQIVTTILFVLYGWIVLYFVFNVLVVNYRLINFLESLRRARTISGIFEFQGFGNSLTISRSIEAIEIKLVGNDETKVVYWETSLGNCPLEQSKKYNVTFANNFLLDYEEVKDD